MSNKDGTEFIFMIIAAIVILAALFFYKTFGLDFKTALELTLGHVFFVAWLVGVFFIVKHAFIRWVLLIPFTLTIYFGCWIPAFNYWGSHTTLDGLENSVWYATAWVQFLIMFSIMVIGHFMIYFLETERRG